MPAVPARTAQQRDARELALTPQPDPYRGSLVDPFSVQPAVQPQPVVEPEAVPPLPRGSYGTPGQATTAGVLGLALAVCLALAGISLFTLVSLQSEYGAPDRSFYRGTDSGYVILGLVDLGLAACCGIGAIMLFTGRVTGRIAMTVGGWGVLGMSAFWLIRGQAATAIPIIAAIAAAVMLALCYYRSVTRWLGVLLPPQPE